MSAQMADRFQRRRWWRRFVAVVYVLSLCVYLAWRYTIINEESLFLSSAYFIAECFGFVLGLITIATSWTYRHRKPKPAPEGLSVDVLIPTYQEPLEILRRTVMAARDLRYPHETWVLDDGRRPEVKALARELGVHYRSRPENVNAKGGNLNYGLSQSQADFVMVQDADHIVLPHALDLMLGFFTDAAVGLVQAPQDYYNINAFQYMNSRRTGGLWHDQSFFYNIAQPCRDSMEGASCVGTGVVYRRATLEQIGGIPTETVTEDIHTSLKMHKAGWKVVNLNESVAYGVAASDLAEYYKTRHRWAHGNLHVLQHENILFCKGLTVRQRLSYLSLGLIYLEGWQQLLLFLIPVIALVFGLPPFEISVFNILIVLSFPIFSYFMLQEIGCGFARFWANELFAMARWPVHLVATAGLFGKRIRFHSSSKNIKGQVKLSLMAPQLVVLGLSLGALMFAIIRLAGDFQTGPLFDLIFVPVTSGFQELPEIDVFAEMPEGYTLDLVAVAGAWAFYSIIRVFFFLWKVFEDASQTHDFFRFSVPLPLVLDEKRNWHGRVRQLSESWISFQAFAGGDKIEAGGLSSLQVGLPTGFFPLTIRVETATPLGKGKGQRVEGRLVWSTVQDRDALAKSLYSVDWHREFLSRNEYFLTVSDVVMGLFGKRLPRKQSPGCWRAVLYHPQNGEKTVPVFGVMLPSRFSGGRLSLITFAPLALGQVCVGTQMFEDKAAALSFRIEKEEPVSSLVEEGLDQAVVWRYAVTPI